MTTNHNDTTDLLESAIAAILLEMQAQDSTSEEYKRMVEQLSKLYHLKRMDDDIRQQQADRRREDEKAEYENRRVNAETVLSEAEAELKRTETAERIKESLRRIKVDHNTVALIAGNLLGIAVIVGYERANVLTSKALSFIKNR